MIVFEYFSGLPLAIPSKKGEDQIWEDEAVDVMVKDFILKLGITHHLALGNVNSNAYCIYIA